MLIKPCLLILRLSHTNNKDTFEYIFVSNLAKEHAKKKEEEINMLFESLIEYTEPVVGKKCIEKIRQYLNPYSFVNYGKSDVVFSGSYGVP